MAICYQNPLYLKQAQKKQNALYNGKVLSRYHEPLSVYDSELQNQTLSSGLSGRCLKESSDIAKVKNDIDDIETISVELEYSVATFLKENQHLLKENEQLKVLPRSL
ncbi:hypothetical protein Tco_0067182 [Tanacetum coccineum]